MAHPSGHASSDSNPDPSQSSRPIPYIGCRLSLISKVGVRYEGTLLGVDSEKGELTLGNARSYGTEERRVEKPIAPQPCEYHSITFKGNSISELMVSESVGADPAVVQAQSAPGSTVMSSLMAGNLPAGALTSGSLTSGVQPGFPGVPVGATAQASQPRAPLPSASVPPPMPPGRFPYSPAPLYQTMPPVGAPLGPIGSQSVGFQQQPQGYPPSTMGLIAPPAQRPPGPYAPTQATPNIARDLPPPGAFASPPQMAPAPQAGFIGQNRPAPQPVAPTSLPQAPTAQPQPIRLAPEQPPVLIQSPVNKPMGGYQPPNLPPRLAAQANSAFSQPPHAHAQTQASSQPTLSSAPSASQATSPSYPAPGLLASATQQQGPQLSAQVDRQRQEPQAPDAFSDQNKQRAVEEPGGEEAPGDEEDVADYTEASQEQSRGPAGDTDLWSHGDSQDLRTSGRNIRTVEYPPDEGDTVAVWNSDGAAGASPQQKSSARPMKYDAFTTSTHNRTQPDSQGYQRGFGMGRGRARGGRGFQRAPLPAWSQDNQVEVPAIPGQLGAPRMMTVTLNTSFTNRAAEPLSASTRRTLEPRGFGGFHVTRGGMMPAAGDGTRGPPRGGAQQYNRPSEYEPYENELEKERVGGFYSQTPPRGRGWFTSGPMSYHPPPQNYQDVGMGYGSTQQGSGAPLRGRARGFSGSSSSTRGGSAGPPQQRTANHPELNWPSSNSRWGGWGWSGAPNAGGPPASFAFSAGQRQSGFQQTGNNAFGHSSSGAYFRGRGGRGGYEPREAGAQQVKRQQAPRPRRGSDGELNPSKITVSVGNDYDFESNNAMFAKLEALSIDGLDKSGLSPAEGHAEEHGGGDKTLEEVELAENEPVLSKEHESMTASEGAGEESSAAATAGMSAVNLSVQLNVNVSAAAGAPASGANKVSGASTPSQPVAGTYSKTRSFFDNLNSNENKDAPIHLSDDRKLNVETFGPGAANLRRFGGRARFVGRGASRGSRGFQRRWPR